MNIQMNTNNQKPITNYQIWKLLFGVLFLGFALVVTGSGCYTVREAKPQAPTINQVIKAQPETKPQTLPADFERRTVVYTDGRQVTWIMVPLKADAWSWSLANDPANPKTVNAWRESLKSYLVINGSLF